MSTVGVREQDFRVNQGDEGEFGREAHSTRASPWLVDACPHGEWDKWDIADLGRGDGGLHRCIGYTPHGTVHDTTISVSRCDALRYMMAVGKTIFAPSFWSKNHPT